jgi:hypothetical protein
MRRRYVAGGILAVGWTAALAIYVSAPAAVDDPEIYDMEHSKTYVRQMEVIGGRAAMFATQFDDWFAGLWQGRPLAYTIAFLTLVVALLYFAWDRGGDPAPSEPAEPKG